MRKCLAHFLRCGCLLTLLVSLNACNQVVVVLEKLPDDTPPNEPIYLSGDFNNWDEDDERYRFYPLEDGRMGLGLPMMQGTVECKVTRGSWLNVEADSCGNDVPNRRLVIDANGELSIEVENWKDRSAALCDFVEVVVDCEAPVDAYDDLYLCGSHNDWKLYDPLYRLRPISDGRFVGRLPRRSEVIQFKVNRGDWSTVEVDEDGTTMENRLLSQNSPDSMHLTVHAWNDMVVQASPRFTVVIDSMPPTAAGAEFFFASNINGWDPAAPDYRFMRPPGQDKFMLTFPRRGERVFFKITQGSWSTVETEANGIKDIENREWEFGWQDTMHIQVQGWRDFN